MTISRAIKVLATHRHDRILRGSPATSDVNQALTMAIRGLSFLEDITKPGDRLAVSELDTELALAIDEIEQVVARVKRAEALASRKAPTEPEWATEHEIWEMQTSAWYSNEREPYQRGLDD